MSSKIESGWLLEKSDPPLFLALDGGLWTWTLDAKAALRLARRTDAEALAEVIEDAWRTSEHHFG